MANENRDARRSKGYKPFWEGEEEEEAPSTEKSDYDWSGLKNRLVGNKTAAEVATEEAEKLKKKQGM
jgi:hypothetical protein